jgi:hypothetical protein
METPLKVKASVVVPIIVAMQTPDKKVRRWGNGTLTPKKERRPAYFHHPIAVMKPSMAAAVAITEAGRRTVPGTGPMPGKIPLDKALVSPL